MNTSTPRDFACDSVSIAQADEPQTTLSIKQAIFLAIACCFTLANMYAAQPILSDIALTMHIDIANSGIIITLAQIGYCMAVLLLVPLGDVLENRKLITWLFMGAAIALLLISQSSMQTILLPAFFLLGLSSSLVQLIIPYSTNLIASAQRGKLTGFIVAGASLGMVLGRPLSSLLTQVWGWQMTFLASCGLMILSGILFRLFLPARKPTSHNLSYPAIFTSMGKLFLSLPILRLQISLMTLIFFCFALFWATVPMVLQQDLFFSHADVALFSLVSLSAPIFVILGGIFSDKGLRLFAIGVGVMMTLCAFLISPILGASAITLLLAIFFMDSGVNTANVLIQQSVLMLMPQARSRLNALCISIVFIGGAMGSFLGPLIYKNLGWMVTSIIGAIILFVALAVYIRLVQINKCIASSIQELKL